MKKICGLYTALITPFDTNGKLDEDGLRNNIRFQIEQGVDGILVLGTTGETPTLSTEEKIQVIRIAREETSGKIRLMVGTGSYSTKTAIENSRLAEEMEADSLLVVTPYYNKPMQQGLIYHFEAVAQAVNIPIMLYNIQSRCGQNITTETLEHLAQVPNIAGVKEASGNLLQIMDVINKIEFSVMSGDDALTFPIMALGGDGVISVASNLIPKEVKKLISSQEKDLHYQLLPLFKSLFIETNPIPVKTAMNMVGMAAGSCRLPLCEMQPENLQQLEKIWSHETKILKD